MTYQEYFKEKKEETLRLLDFYGETQRKVKEEKENIAKRIAYTEVSLEDTKKSIEEQEKNLFGSLVKISPAMLSYYSLYLNQPLLVLGFFIMFCGVQEMEHSGLVRQTPFSWKKNRSTVRRVKFLEKKQERLENEEKRQEYLLEQLEEIIGRLGKELVYWVHFEEFEQGKTQEITMEGIKSGNKMSETLRGDLMIELFGTLESPEKQSTFTKQFVD